MKLSLPAAVTTRAARTVLVTKKHSPRILFVSGLALMAGSVVTACNGTLQLEEVLDEVRRDRLDLQRALDKDPERFTERSAKRLHATVTLKGLVKVTKLYLPAISLGVAAVTCLTVSHNQLSRRNAGISAALAATERALDSYRNRVREAYGEDREMELWRGEHTETVPVLDDEGRETKSTKKVKKGGGHSPYARIWGRDTSTEWSPQPEYNLAKLRSIQEWGTMQIGHKGHLFLNEILDELGLERMPAGQIVGWMAKKYGGKDGYVDFGIMEPGEEIRFFDFLTGDEEHILLDFNVDGEVWRSI
jgi:hypothetical protein